MKWQALFLFLLLIWSAQTIYSEENISAAHLIADQIKKGLESHENRYIATLISGIEAREKGLLLSNDELRAHSLHIEKQRAFLSQTNLRDAENWMKNLQLKEEAQFIIPSKLAFYLVKQGNGKLLTQEFGKVIVNYSIKKIGDYFPETTGLEKELDLSQVIPGIAHGMLNMREGEIRTICIHPDLAYRTSNFDPNIALEATVELLYILPDRVTILPLPDFPHYETFEITQAELDLLQLKNYYVLGWKLWDHLRWGYKLFTKEDLVVALREEPLPNIAPRYDQEINRIHWTIYHQRIENEYKAADTYFKVLSTQSDIKCLVPGYLYCRTQDLRDKPVNKMLFNARMTIKNKEGIVLIPERLETVDIKGVIKGLKEGLPYLVSQKAATLFIHPRWAFPDVDGPLGDKLLIVDVELD